MNKLWNRLSPVGRINTHNAFSFGTVYAAGICMGIGAKLWDPAVTFTAAAYVFLWLFVNRKV